MRIAHGLENLSDVVVRTAAYVAFVKTRRTEKITETIQELEHTCQNLVAGLRLFPVSGQILRELRVYSKHGTYRFFSDT
jgi:S-adenosylmethionine:diacylglycerol 3-amino-3-carboxypropyl transferase